MDGQPVPIRAVRLGRFSASAQTHADGSVRVRSTLSLGPYPRSIVDALENWAQKTPDAVLIADRDNDGWRKLTFAEVRDRLLPLGQALLDAGVSPERPLMIVSGNEIEHFLLGLAAIWVGVVDGQPVLDLPYVEDSTAETDMNVVMTGKGLFVEVQGTAEGAPFSRAELDALLGLAEGGIRQIHALQREYLAEPPTPRPIGR